LINQKYFIKVINIILCVGKIGSLAFAEGLASCVGAKDNVPMWAGNKIVLKKCAVGKNFKNIVSA